LYPNQPWRVARSSTANVIKAIKPTDPMRETIGLAGDQVWYGTRPYSAGTCSSSDGFRRGVRNFGSRRCNGTALLEAATLEVVCDSCATSRADIWFSRAVQVAVATLPPIAVITARPHQEISIRELGDAR
jgi:hypothetical protein